MIHHCLHGLQYKKIDISDIRGAHQLWLLNVACGTIINRPLAC